MRIDTRRRLEDKRPYLAPGTRQPIAGSQPPSEPMTFPPETACSTERCFGNCYNKTSDALRSELFLWRIRIARYH
jgi:hypothetical protein